MATPVFVAEANCHCDSIQPDPEGWAVDSVWSCPSCHQQWKLSLRRSQARAGGGAVVGGVLVGGIGRAREVRYWRKVGPNVALLANRAAARVADEEAYASDHAVVRALVARDPQMWSGLTVKRYRQLCGPAKVITWCGRAIYRYPTQLELFLSQDRVGYQIRRWFPKSDDVRIAL